MEDNVVLLDMPPADMTEQTLRQLCRAQFASLPSDSARLYVRLRSDSCASPAQARKATNLSAADSKRMEAHVVKYFLALRSRRCDVDRGEILEMYQEIYDKAKSRGNTSVMLASAKSMAELGGVSTPATDLHDLPTDGTASDLSAAILQKVASGACTVDQATKLLAGVQSAANTQLQEEERQRLQQDRDLNPHAPGTIPWTRVENLKTAERNMRLTLEKFEAEKLERQTLIDITPEDSE